MPSVHVRKYSILLVNREIEIKSQWDTTSDILEQLKLKTGNTNVGEDKEQLELLYITTLLVRV